MKIHLVMLSESKYEDFYPIRAFARKETADD